MVNMEELIAIQDDISSSMSKAKTNFKKTPKERLTVSYIETRIQNLERQWTLFTNTHTQLVSSVKKAELANSNYVKKDMYDAVEELYVVFISELKDMLRNLNSKDSLPNVKSCYDVRDSDKLANKVRLPEIRIPTFSGKYTEWQTFRDLFSGLVHENQLLDDAQKLFYLKGHLTGEAEQMLRNVKVNIDNYKIAWDKLNKMYNNKRFLAKGILKRLLNQRILLSESASDIKGLINTTTDCLDSIKTLGVDVSSWDILIIYIISAKLDPETKKAWELKVSSDPSDDLPTFEEFSQFLIGRFRGLENLELKPRVEKKLNTKSFHTVKSRNSVLCTYCSGDHRITACKAFCKESNECRRSFVMDKKLCFVCLNSNHSAKFCKNITRCHVCKRRHHSLLHPSGGSGLVDEDTVYERPSTSRSRQEETVSSSSKLTAQAEGSNEPLVSCLSTGNCSKTVLLTTAVVQAESKGGTFQMVRALLDQGSQGSFINEATVQYLGLKKIAGNHTITGVGGDKGAISKSTVRIKLRSRVDPLFQIEVNAYVLKSITSFLPVAKVTRSDGINLTFGDLADPEYHRPNKIDILLGAEVYSQIIKEGIKRNIGGSLLAQDTTLGWIISGVGEVDQSTNFPSNISVGHCSLSADSLLKMFWELEAEPTVNKRLLTEEENKCEAFFTATTKRNSDGRYIVRLPFRDADPDCKYGDSRKIAEKRFKCLEHKLERNITLKRDYTKVIKEYLELNHMKKVTDSEKGNTEAVYLPHHAVVREDKDTTKVRVVFDASCKGSNGKSLNDNLMVGPPLQSELRHTLMRWRRHRICLVADIIKMYRQVLVSSQDTLFQRILWRDDPEKELEEFELVTVTFGTAAAPYLAVRSLQQIAADECQGDPELAKIILNDFYMDDLMSGTESIDQGYKIYKHINEVLAKGGFKLQKWASNSCELLDLIKLEGQAKDEEFKIKMGDTTKILGLTWNPREDFFQYSINLASMTGPATKRKILSNISKLFDPLGWLAPSIILAKLLIQKLWLAGIDWDKEVSNSLKNEWDTYLENLGSLSNIKVPRWLNTSADAEKVELHGFSDASKLAYAAVVYLRVLDNQGNVHISLITSKTKVAPIKQVSIPRLELCGAVLLAKLMMEVSTVMNINKEHLYAFTDSEVVLAWLNDHPSRWKTFVANRASEILTTLDNNHWFYVPSKQNPADCASRGISPAELPTLSLWFEGPDFLRQRVVEYKKPRFGVTQLEQVRVHTVVIDDFWNKFSSLPTLVRVIAYCRRFLNLRRGVENKPKELCLSSQEIEQARDVCVRKSQEQTFSEEIEELKIRGSLSRNRKGLQALNIFLDSTGVIRVGGRLEMSQLKYDEKHPILISKGSFLTRLLIADAHHKTMHGGPSLMIAYLRTKYWIVGIKVLAKAHCRRCVVCIRYAAKTQKQLMGQLPMSRVTPNKPFLMSGVDYAGPLNIRTSKGRGNKSYKGYIALFVCMSTRAVHLEAVSELSTQGFLAAFRRFVARRGRCAELHSDNGTNFVGAARELQYLFNEQRSDYNPELANYLANNGTSWQFTPPRAPNFGGLWEAAIKSTKFHLKRVIGNSTLTFEEISTVLSQIEACLNSRPLSYVPDEQDLMVLTPGHFLVGEPLVVVPDLNYISTNINNLRRWQLHQRMMQDFWRRWSKDYLHQFLQRHKWEYQNPEPALGDVVLIKEDDMPPGKWLLGKIEKKHPGHDNVTRVVTIRTKGSLIKRPTSKLCMLPVAS